MTLTLDHWELKVLTSREWYNGATPFTSVSIPVQAVPSDYRYRAMFKAYLTVNRVGTDFQPMSKAHQTG